MQKASNIRGDKSTVNRHEPFARIDHTKTISIPVLLCDFIIWKLVMQISKCLSLNPIRWQKSWTYVFIHEQDFNVRIGIQLMKVFSLLLWEIVSPMWIWSLTLISFSVLGSTLIWVAVALGIGFTTVLGTGFVILLSMEWTIETLRSRIVSTRFTVLAERWSSLRTISRIEVSEGPKRSLNVQDFGGHVNSKIAHFLST